MLDNPIWSSLTTCQSGFAIGDGRARRFPADMAPFVAIGRDGAEEVDAMGRLAGPGETLTIVGLVPGVPAGWVVEKASAVSQMVYQGREGEPSDDPGLSTLGPRDLPDMLGLMAEVYPGYFRPRTRELGTYLGVRHEGRLIAMAGQRLCLEGYREISGVATHPSYRGRGLASRLIARLVGAILREGMVPFLHVDSDNLGARGAYEKAGFARRSDLKMLRLRREC